MASPTRLQNRFGLAGKTCVITGAGGGIGREIALSFAREGAFVVILDLNAATAEETKRLVDETGAESLWLTCDVSSESDVAKASEMLASRFGRGADVLVNNAAMNHMDTLADIALADWNRVLSVNLTAFLICAQIFGKAMLARGEGSIVNVSSLAAEYLSPGQGAYSVAKAGVTMLSRALGIEWGPLGVRSNAVHPGLVNTPMSKATYDIPGVLEKRTQSIPVRRIAQSGEIANTILFLASPLSSYINATEVRVDGGFAPNLLNLIPRFTGSDGKKSS